MFLVQIETRNAEESEDPVVLPQKCIKLRECYPILFLTDRTQKDEPTSINSDLIEFILETSEVCKPSGHQALKNASRTNPGDLYIWCRIGLQKESSVEIPAGKPLVVGTKVEDENSLCAPIKVSRQANSEERVVGGTDAKQGEAPYMVSHWRPNKLHSTFFNYVLYYLLNRWLCYSEESKFAVDQ